MERQRGDGTQADGDTGRGRARAGPAATPRSPTARFAPVYDLLVAPFEHAGLRRWRRRAWRRVPRSGLGLEVGLGTGANQRFHDGRAVVGLDLSPRMLRHAQHKPATPPVLAGDAQRLPFPDDAFDWAVATLVFCEVPDPVAGLAEMRRVIRAGGELILLEHVRPAGQVLGRLADALTRITGPLWGEHFDRDAEANVRAAGWSVRTADYGLRGALVIITAHG
jgi:phosphatidylethanolamine/phosphatidyl-N-methylethanolamine N-methyltransferase